MKQERFEKVMKSIDPRFLEEAQQPAAGKLRTPLPAEAGGPASKPADGRRRLLQRGGVILACLCLVLAGTRFLTPAADTAQAATREELESLGYVMDLPETAEDTSYSLVQNDSGETAIAQAEFTEDGESYCYRILKDTAETALFEGAEAEKNVQTGAQTWTGESYSITVSDAADRVQVSWYSPQSETQWCLATSGSRQNAVNTAYSILQTLGFEIGSAPEGAENISYDIVTVKALPDAQMPEAVDGKSAAQLTFDLAGVHYVYRIASPDGVPDEIPDISEAGAAYTKQDTDTSIGWCITAAYWNENADGKILWFDVAPGVTYSLTMDRAATGSALHAMANVLYSPMQGDD